MNSVNEILLKPSFFSSLNGEVNLVSSKSIANRALLLSALSPHSIDLTNCGTSDDVEVMRNALESKETIVNVGMAGTAMRFLTAGFSLMPGTRIIDGDSRLKDRPIEPLIKALRKLGANITYLEKKGSIPIEIQGANLVGDYIELNQEYSSQFVSALMMIAPFLKNGLTIKRKGKRRSESYVYLTKSVMDDFGLNIKMEDDTLIIPPGTPNIKAYNVEGDWSAASYWMAFVALIPNSKITLLGLKENSEQGDKKMLEVLSDFNVSHYWQKDKLVLFHDEKGPQIRSFKYDCSDIPDQAQTLAFLCSALGVEAELSGLETLLYKETNRIQAISNELSKLGLDVQYSDSKIEINGSVNVEKVEIATYNDHRMAMAASLLGTRLETIIVYPDVVSKSYPMFWDDLQGLTNGF